MLISPNDVRAVRRVFLSLGLPIELVLAILDLAAYHASVRAQRTDEVAISTWQGVANCAALLYLVSLPLPKDCRKVKKVVWTVDGHDQGWGREARGQYASTYSWYDACILRQPRAPDAPAPAPGPRSRSPLARSARRRGEPRRLLPSLSRIGTEQPDVTAHPLFHRLHPDPASMERAVLAPAGWAFVRNSDGDSESCVWRLQSNRIAQSEYERHTVEWTAAGRQQVGDVDEAEAKAPGAGDGAGFVDALRAGDRIGIWMRALYPGWVNFLKEAAVQVMFEVE